MTLQEVTHALDLAFQDEVSKLLAVLMMKLRSKDDNAQEVFEQGLAHCLRAHDLAVESARKLFN